MSWRDEAACVGHEQHFFPDGVGLTVGERGMQERTAKAICASCPVIKECDQYATKTGSIFGVWGGKSPEERTGISAYMKRPNDGRCTLHDCDLEYVAKGYCATHYNRLKRWGDPRHGEGMFGRSGFTLDQLAQLDDFTANHAANVLGADRKTVVGARKVLAEVRTGGSRPASAGKERA